MNPMPISIHLVIFTVVAILIIADLGVRQLSTGLLG